MDNNAVSSSCSWRNDYCAMILDDDAAEGITHINIEFLSNDIFPLQRHSS